MIEPKPTVEPAPTVGRIVHYRRDPDTDTTMPTAQGDTYAALVAAVHDDGRTWLSIYPPGRDLVCRVALQGDGPGEWTWPPRA